MYSNLVLKFILLTEKYWVPNLENVYETVIWINKLLKKRISAWKKTQMQKQKRTKKNQRSIISQLNNVYLHDALTDTCETIEFMTLNNEVFPNIWSGPIYLAYEGIRLNKSTEQINIWTHLHGYLWQRILFRPDIQLKSN